jgi:hypothetical protein
VGLKVDNPTDDQTKPVKVRQVQKKIGGILPRDGRMRRGVKSVGKKFCKRFLSNMSVVNVKK